MSGVDITIYALYLGAYSILVLGIGVYHSLKIKSEDEYLVADRRVGFWRIVGSMVATTCGAAAFIGFVGLGFNRGISGIFYWIVPYVFFSVGFALLFGRVLSRLRRYTIPDVFALRFGRLAAFVPALFQIIVYSIPTLAIQLIGLGTIFTTLFSLDMKVGIVLGFGVIVVYTYLGGMPTTILTDALQSVILTVGLFVLFIFSVHYAGGVSRVIAITPPQFLDPLGNAGFIQFISLALTIGPFYIVWQTTWQRIFASKDESTAVRGVTTGAILAGLILALSFLIGIVARGYLPHDLRPDLVFTQAISTVFPAVAGGVVVLGLTAAIMSGADSFVMMGSASLAKDIYQQYFRPDADEHRMLRAARLSSVAISVLALAVAFIGKGIIPIYLLVVKAMGASLVFPFLALMFWPRATRKGVLGGMVVGLAVTIVWHIVGNPWIMEAIPGYVSCLTVMVLVSLLTKHAYDERDKAFYFHGFDHAKDPRT